MNIKTVDILGFASLILSAISVAFLLVLDKPDWVQPTLILCGIILGILVFLTMFPRRCHTHFLELCGEKSLFLYGRLVVAILLFTVGWYISSTMPSVFGAESEAVLGNENVMLCPIFALFGHVIHAGCVKKAKKMQNSEGISPKLGKLHKKL
ncbi:MAG: hypothetical protein R3Y62_07780 [Eubacteriales bacterium]